jgi:hydroxypyruvate isomerase
VVPGESRGLGALPGREAEFRALFARGLEWSRTLGAPMAMCSLAGLRPEGVSLADCEATLIANLRWAAPRLAEAGITMLVEPHCSKDFPGYVLDKLDQARRVVDAVASPHVRILLDTYHSQRMEGNLTGHFLAHRAAIAHVQIGNPPGRHEPDQGEVNHRNFFRALDEAGYGGLVAGEYFPARRTRDGLGWIDDWGVARA